MAAASVSAAPQTDHLLSSYIPAKYDIYRESSTTLYYPFNTHLYYPIYGFVTVVPAFDPATLLLAHAREEGAPHIRI